MIKLIESYPYDNKYDIVKMFSNKSEQEIYFDRFSYTGIDEFTFEKINECTINVPYSYEYLTNNNVNYLIIEDNGKTYYAFIIGKNWIAEDVTQLIYEIDVIQTFMFDFKTKSSFIERMNCTIEEIADFDEGLEIGEHAISKEITSLQKEYTYYAMFGGIKQECITIDSNGNVKSSCQLNTSISTPMTKIDNIDYPLYFVELKESYDEPSMVEVLP